MGRAVILRDSSKHTKSETGSENERVSRAVNSFIAENEAALGAFNKDGAKIIQSRIALVKDSALLNSVYGKIDGGKTADDAVRETFGLLIKSVSKRNATDIRDIRDSILRILNGGENGPSAFPENSVLVAHELKPTVICRMNTENITAAVCEIGGITSHSAILLRSLGIPAVFGVKNAPVLISDGDFLSVDGSSGEVVISPDEAENYIQKAIKNDTAFILPVQDIKLLANVCTESDILKAAENGCDGIGLFRTEFLFVKGDTEPGEEEQFRFYSTAAALSGDKETVIRTLDLAPDKAPPCFKSITERESISDIRGVRFSLKYKGIFRRQLRALLRAACFGNIKILLPFICTPEELKAAKAVINECAYELERKGVNYRVPPLGVMIETPSAALMSEPFAREADFFSIGTNDLTALTFGADRESGYFHKADIAFEAVMREIEMTVKNAKKANIPVCICGEAASDKRLLSDFIKMGVSSVSVSPADIPNLKSALSRYE